MKKIMLACSSGMSTSILLSKFQQATDKPVEVIDMMAYGMADGKAAYEQAVKLMG